jgi:hypothetical protein
MMVEGCGFLPRIPLRNSQLIPYRWRVFFRFFFPFFFAALGGVESDTCGRTLFYVSTLSLRRGPIFFMGALAAFACQDHPLASEILIKFGGQSIVSHWIGVAEAVVSAAL